MISFKRISMARSLSRHISRFREISGIIARYGFGDILVALRLSRYFRIWARIFRSKKKKDIENYPRPVRVRMAMEELGGAFIKLGQILSTRPDLISVQYIEELSKLQDKAPEFDFKDVKKILEKEFSGGISAHFDSIDEKPIAAASIAQVHKATLNSGESAAIKVLRPGIRKDVEIDMEILYQIAAMAERNIEEFSLHKPAATVEEFTRTLDKEMDLSMEALNINYFRKTYSSLHYIEFPYVYKDLSTERALVMKYIDGVKIYNIERLKAEGYNLPLLARRGAEFTLKQIFEYGVFHGDPHPGNIFALPGDRLCYVDFGQVGRISEMERRRFAEMLYFIYQKNPKRVSGCVLELTNHTGSVNREEIEREIAEFIGRYVFLPLKDIKLKNLLYDLINVLTRHGLAIKPHLFLMMKALSAMDNIGRKLDPDFEIIKYAGPFVKRILKERLSPKRIAGEVNDYAHDLYTLVRGLPSEIDSITKQLRQGNFKFEMQHKGLKDMVYVHNMISKRLSISIILASVIIGSSLIVLSDVPPKWGGISVLGLAGLIIASIIGLGMLISFVWRGR